jgi:CBS domain-containing protein
MVCPKSEGGPLKGFESMLSTSLTARDIMVKKLITVGPDEDLFDVIDLLVRNKISGAPVVDETGRYLGIFSERTSISLLVDAAQRGTPTNRIEPFIDRDAITVTPETDLWTIAQILMTTHYRRLPVLQEDGKVVGLISRRDVLKAANAMLQPVEPQESSFLFFSSVRERSQAPVA